MSDVWEKGGRAGNETENAAGALPVCSCLDAASNPQLLWTSMLFLDPDDRLMREQNGRSSNKRRGIGKERRRFLLTRRLHARHAPSVSMASPPTQLRASNFFCSHKTLRVHVLSKQRSGTDAIRMFARSKWKEVQPLSCTPVFEFRFPGSRFATLIRPLVDSSRGTEGESGFRPVGSLACRHEPRPLLTKASFLSQTLIWDPGSQGPSASGHFSLS